MTGWSGLGLWTIDLSIVLVMTLLGTLAIVILLGRAEWRIALSVGFPLAFGWVTWWVFVLSWIGVRITLATYLGVAAATWLILLLLYRRVGWRGGPPPGPEPTDARWDRSRMLGALAIAGCAALALAAFVIAVGRSYSSWDAMALYSIKGYAIAREGSVQAAREWGAHGLAYPLNLTLAITLFRLVDADGLPGSKLVYAGYYGSTLLLFYTYWRSRGVPLPLRALGTFLCASAPILFEHGTNGYSNLAYAYFLVGGAAWGLEGIENKSPRLQALGGVLLGLATWTRPDGVAMAVVVAVILIAYGFTLRREHPPGIFLLAPLAGLSLPWVIFMNLNSGAAQHLEVLHADAGSLALSDLHLGALLVIGKDFLRQIVDVKTWGLLIPTCGLLIMVGFRRWDPHVRGRIGVLIATSAALLGVITLFYYLTTFGDQTLDWWLSTTRGRMLFPCALLLLLASILAASTAGAGAASPPAEVRRIRGKAARPRAS